MIMTICMLKDYGKYKNGMKYTISADVALRLIEDGVAFSCWGFAEFRDNWTIEQNLNYQIGISRSPPPSISGLGTRKARVPGSAVGKLVIVSDDDDHLRDFSEYME